jgi:hypothetical protein
MERNFRLLVLLTCIMLKTKFDRSNLKSMKCFVPLLIGCALLSGGCSNNQQASVGQNTQEIDRLRAENQDLGKLRAENQEVQRFQKENQDIHKLRGQNQELSRARKENDDLRRQAAKFGLARSGASSLTPEIQAQQAAALLHQNPTDANLQTIEEKDTPQEGDEILIEPKFLAALLPDIDWTKLNRTEPIGVKTLLDQQKIVITNYQQLVNLGITNYVIRRAEKIPADELKNQ